MKTLLALLPLLSTAHAQENSWPGLLSEAYAFVQSQRTTMDAISEKLPDLSAPAEEATTAFDSGTFGKAYPALEAELKTMLGEKWQGYKETLGKNISESVSGYDFTKEEATGFIADVKERAKGNMDPAVKKTMLAAYPEYAKSTRKEIEAGWTQTFPTEQTPNFGAYGFTVTVPESWATIGNGSLMKSQAGHGSLVFVPEITILDTAPDVKMQAGDFKFFMKEETLKTLLPNGAVMDIFRSTMLGGKPAAVVTFDKTKTREDGEVSARTIQYIIPDDDRLTKLSFIFGTTGQTEQEIQAATLKNQLLISPIATSFKPAE